MKVIDGCSACANMAYNFSDISFIYPITPSSPMASQIDKISSENGLNIFNDTVNVVEMQSEAGAAGALHGALSAGLLATTFTASQGLLLMMPNMYKIAGECLPGVIHVAARSLASHALSIFGDHQDIYAARTTGFCMLSSTNVQDAYNLALVAHLSAIEGSLPFLHFFDGFRTSHEYNQIKEIDKKEIFKLVNFEKIEEFRNRALNSEKCITKGTNQNEDIYFQSVEARNKDYNNIPLIVNNFMQKVNNLTGMDYKPFNYYGSDKAKYVIVAMGSVCDTIKEVVNAKINEEFGMVEVHLYRPFSAEFLKNVLPETVTNIAVLDRTKESGSIGEPLYLDVLAALSDMNIKIVGGRYGLSSKNTTPSDIYDVFMNLKSENKNNFTVGIDDDVTFTSLKQYGMSFKNDYREFKIYGFGSDGMVSASKNILKILGSSNFVQGYFEYDSKKSGGVTISHLRLADRLIEAPYYVTNPLLVVVTKDEYFYKFDMLSGIKDGGTLLINTIRSEEELNRFLPDNVKKQLKEKMIKVYIIDAESLASSKGIKGKISLIMEACILELLKIDNYRERLFSDIKATFATKGEDIVKANLECVQEFINYLKEILIDDLPGIILKKSENIFEMINSREGNLLKVSDLEKYKDGVFPGGTSALEKRKMSSLVPKWNKEKCIECGFCATVCPHAVIRPFVIGKDEYVEDAKMALDKENNFIMGISEADCTSCGLCINICPTKCLEFGSYDDRKQKLADDLFKRDNSLESSLEEIKSIKQLSLKKPLFEFSGACAGCGETPYIKMLTQVVGEKLVIANATGCSSIYGASCPNTPYKVSWGNSLFEDNAEYGFGILSSYNKLRTRIVRELEESSKDGAKEVLNYYLENGNDYAKMVLFKDKIKDYISNDLISYVTPKSVWAIGGDGWAYDIGYGGIDHVLASNQNIKILVLDTEVYSNTGGQASKSSRLGVVAEFANNGKKTVKKDLFKIAMSYPNVYVAQVSLGANMNHTLNVFKEAEAHVGPAIVIAYSSCVEHGIHGGMINSINEEKLAVNAGYTLLMRYKDGKLIMDSKKPDFDKYEEFLNNEVRYKALKIKNKKMADELLSLNKTEAIKRYHYYKNLSEN